jgi:hypothetical protein
LAQTIDRDFVGRTVECTGTGNGLPSRQRLGSREASSSAVACEIRCMSLAVVLSRSLAGLDAPLVTVEVHLAGGLPAFNLVGLPDTEVKESRDRVRSALQNAQFEFPARKITVQWLYNRSAEAIRGVWVHRVTTR